VGGGEGENPINEDIVLVKDCCRGAELKIGEYMFAAWSERGIYTTLPLRLVTLDEDLNARRDTILIHEGNWHYVHPNRSGDRLLLVKSNFFGVSVGALYEYNVPLGTLRLLRDSTVNVSSAVYWPGDEDRLVYYSYGQMQGTTPLGEGAGYYVLDLTTGADSLLVGHLSSGGLREMVNGFDLSPDGRTLLYPNVRAPRTGFLPPQAVAYDLETGNLDTLAVSFDQSWVRIGLWLRYSPNGRQILYCSYPTGATGHITNDDSQVGLIDRATLARRILDVNTTPGGRSVQLAPTWSPSGRHIAYGSGKLFEHEGAKGRYSLYILKDVR